MCGIRIDPLAFIIAMFAQLHRLFSYGIVYQ